MRTKDDFRVKVGGSAYSGLTNRLSTTLGNILCYDLRIRITMQARTWTSIRDMVCRATNKEFQKGSGM